MPVNTEAYLQISHELTEANAVLVAVSKTKPVADIEALYELGQRDFGENYVQELVDKEALLPKDIRWHFIGHLQTNKVKYIAPFVHLIHGVDTAKLLKEIDKQAAKNNRVIDCLLQVYIAQEETKFGFDESELAALVNQLPLLTHIRVIGLMGMASFSNNRQIVRGEFSYLKSLFDTYHQLAMFTCSSPVLSMGMSGDYSIALAEGSNLVRIGSLLFGARTYPTK